MFDLAMIKSVYERMNERINAARVILGRPLTLTEKILYSHLATGNPSEQFKRGRSYVIFFRSRGHAGCDCTDGIATVYDGW